MQRKDPRVWSIQTSKGCFHAKKVKVEVPLETVFKEGGRQPRAKLKGYGNGYWLDTSEGEVFLLTDRIIPDALKA